jgi:drug/metabolite transporter superfamily protein YnfA
MIKILKLQKAVIVLILGVAALVVYAVMYMQEMESSMYALEVAGALFMVGALMMLYPILFSKKDGKGAVQLNPEKHGVEETEETKNP